MSGIITDNVGRSGGLIKAAGGATGILLKTYHKMFKGGQSISGYDEASPTVISNYQLAITPQGSGSVFLATYHVSIGSHVNHTFMKAMAMIDGGSFTGLGTQKSTMYNDADYYDMGSWYMGSIDGNAVHIKSNSFYYAPATASEITFGLFCGQHGGTAYFGRSSNNTGNDYTALGMSLRVDEYDSSSNLVNTEYTSG